MNRKHITLIATLTVVVTIALGQEQKKETIKKDGVTNNVTISETGMYNGTASDAARKYYNQGNEYGAAGDLDNAKKYYLKAIREDPKYVEAYDNVGLIYRQKGDLDKATNSPHLSDGYQMVGLVHYYKGEKEEAKKYFKSAKDMGAQIHPQIERELFPKEEDLPKYQLETAADYAGYEQDVIDGVNWLLDNAECSQRLFNVYRIS